MIWKNISTKLSGRTTLQKLRFFLLKLQMIVLEITRGKMQWESKLKALARPDFLLATFHGDVILAIEISRNGDPGRKHR